MGVYNSNEQSTPLTPTSGERSLYPKEDGWYDLDSLGAERKIIHNIPNGSILNGKISPTVATNNLTVSIKTLTGADPTSANPVYVMIGNTLRKITSAISFTLNAGTNWFNAGSSELAANEIDYFTYLGWNETDSVVVLGASRYVAFVRGEFSQTSTNEKFLAESYTTNASATDEYMIIGRFASTLSAAAGHVWTVPSFTPANLIQYPIFETRFLNANPIWTVSPFSVLPTNIDYNYKILNRVLFLNYSEITNGTSNSTANAVMMLPFTTKNLANYRAQCPMGVVDNGVAPTIPGRTLILGNANIMTLNRDWAASAWTSSGNRRSVGLAANLII